MLALRDDVPLVFLLCWGLLDAHPMFLGDLDGVQGTKRCVFAVIFVAVVSLLVYIYIASGSGVNVS